MAPSKEQLLEKLKEVIDPELGLNIVDLGLVYDVAIVKKAEKFAVNIKMTLTSPLCPVGPIIMDEVKKKSKELIEDVTVELVWEPPWTQDALSDEVKLQLGLL